MLKNTDGSPMKKEDFRIILKSDMIINSPYAYLSDMPEDAKSTIAKAFFDAASKDHDAFAQAVGRQEPPLAAGDERRLRQDDRTREVRR